MMIRSKALTVQGVHGEASLPEHFRGTHAWTLWGTADKQYGNKLERYRGESRITSLSLEYVAEHCNLHEEEASQAHFLIRGQESGTAWEAHKAKWVAFHEKWMTV